MEVEKFAELVDEALSSIPEYFRRKLDNISIDVQQLAPADLARSVNKQPWQLLGLYSGVPYPRRNHWYANVLPDRILIFQQPIERQSRTKEEARRLVRRVVIHEVGHYFGLKDDELRRLEAEADAAEERRQPPSHPEPRGGETG
jgi:predicted Zn-dependent protease with MMP-like domain